MNNVSIQTKGKRKGKQKQKMIPQKELSIQSL